MTARNTLFAALAAATAVAAVAAPAAAQPYGYGHDYGRDQGRGYDREVRWTQPSARAEAFDRRIDMGLRNGELTRREHAQLTDELNQIVRLEANYRRHGLDYRERAELDYRYNQLTRDIKRAAYDRDHREYGYGYRR
jgi:hypothetical protein